MKTSLINQVVKKLQAVAYNGLYCGTQRFNNVRMGRFGLEARDCFTGQWSLLDITERLTDCNGRSVNAFI